MCQTRRRVRIVSGAKSAGRAARKINTADGRRRSLQFVHVRHSCESAPAAASFMPVRRHTVVRLPVCAARRRRHLRMRSVGRLASAHTCYAQAALPKPAFEIGELARSRGPAERVAAVAERRRESRGAPHMRLGLEGPVLGTRNRSHWLQWVTTKERGRFEIRFTCCTLLALFFEPFLSTS
jgi:hypothetical protein